MRRTYVQSGMTLFEILVVLATVIILAGALVGVGKHVVRRADIDLTESAIEVIVTALEQYYADFEDFPFHTDVDGDGDSYNDGTGEFDYTQVELQAALDGVVDNGFALTNEQAASARLFYHFDQNPNSRKIIDALTASLVTSIADEVHMTFTFNVTSGGGTIDLPWFVDSWGTAIRYEYLPDTAFPILTSAGPDETFGTADDVTSQ